MPQQWNRTLMTVGVAALCLGLAGCGGADTEKTAGRSADSPDSSQDQKTDVVDESVADSLESANDSADAPAVEDMPTENVDTPEALTPSDSEELAPDPASLSGDAVKGKRVFAKCMSCHTTAEGQNRLGPSLYGVVGKPAGSVEGFKYSPAMSGSGVVWDDAALHSYIENPKTFIPGNRMIFPGVSDAQQRADLIAFLKTAPQ